MFKSFVRSVALLALVFGGVQICSAQGVPKQLSTAPRPDHLDLPKLLDDIGAFFYKVEENQIPQDKSRILWEGTRQWLNDALPLAEKEKPSLIQVTIYMWLGKASYVLDQPQPQPNNVAEKYFATAYKRLMAFKAAGPLPMGYYDTLAILQRYRAANSQLLGRGIEAQNFLAEALSAVRQSGGRDDIEEVKVRTLSAAVAIQQRQWKKALDFVDPALVILSAKDKPDSPAQKLRNPVLWLKAQALVGKGDDAFAVINEYLVDWKKLSIDEQTEAFRLSAFNVCQRAPAEVDSKFMDEKSKLLRQKRHNELNRALSYLTTAKQITDKAPDKKAVITSALAVYLDLANTYAMDYRITGAEATFKEALQLGRQVAGNDSPLLVPVLEAYAKLLDRLKRTQEAKAQLAEADRIALEFEKKK